MSIRLLSLVICLLSLCQLGCLYESYPSHDLESYQSNNKAAKDHLGQVRFVIDDLGSLTIKGLLDVRIMPAKVYETALLVAEGDHFPLASESVPLAMEKYGFIRPDKIANWNSDFATEPKVQVLGYIKTMIEKEIPGLHFKVQVSNLTCSACHSGRLYDSNGRPTNNAWLGTPNTSIDYDSYLDQIYKGLKIAAADNKGFLAKIKTVYPDMDNTELDTIKKFLLPNVNKEIKKMAAMDRVLPFTNGGPGQTNGLAAFKRAAKLHADPYQFKPQEVGFTSVPNVFDRPFRSSLLVDGSYSNHGQIRYHEITKAIAFDPEHIKGLAQLTSFFTFSAMGNSLRNIEPNIPKVEEIYRDFLAHARPPKFPGKIDFDVADTGRSVFNSSCAGCHGHYEGELSNLSLVQFPNKFVSFEKIGSDNYRWYSLDANISKFAKNEKSIAKYVEEIQTQKGYVATILTGIWATAPYMHNGSIPDLWSFMNPELRPNSFMVGGHALDYVKMGITYPEGYTPVSHVSNYNTKDLGKSNSGHESQFKKLSYDQKKALLEYLKLL